ncbi:MAG: carbohydrate-binding family 9-like protein [Bacteroidales bacterium]|jgi:hypothetical protein
MKKNLKIALFSVGCGLLAGLIACSESSRKTAGSDVQLPPKPDPHGYVCYRSTTSVVADGVLNEPSWAGIPWTEYFTDIEGSSRPVPKYKTHAKMLWDDTNLYIAAELEEPHVWAFLKQRDTVIFYDNDFEVFIDPDGDTHSYYELEVNALGTAWDLLLLKPYRDGGPPVNGWDIAGLQVGTRVDGTINDPRDTDKGWIVEIVIPLAALKECASGAKLPKAGDQWRIDFSRVEWRTRIEGGTYKKEINPQTGKPFPEDNWVWSPQGRINMHMPEMWGFVQFSSLSAGFGTESFIIDTDLDIKWLLRKVYYTEFEYFNKNHKYSESLEELGLNMADSPKSIAKPVIQTTRSTFESYIPSANGGPVWTIYQDGRLEKMLPDLPVK